METIETISELEIKPDVWGDDGIPTRLIGLKVYDVLQFRSNEVLSYLDNHFYNGVRCGWNYRMSRLFCGTVIQITPEIMNKITEGYPCITELDEYRISLDMLEFTPIPEPITDNPPPINFSIHNTDMDETIIKEMISKIDLNRFKKLLVIGAKNDDINFKTISPTLVEKYLTEWAYAKYDYYILFGHNLSISTTIESQIDETEMQQKIYELCYAFPQCAATLLKFSMEEYIANSCNGYDNTLSKYASNIYKSGTKVSKIIAKLFNDKGLNDTLASILSNRMINANLTISIDPYDYLTMSINTYEWQSCHRIGSDGCYATGTLSLMLDNTTLISYKHNGSSNEYNLRNIKFEGNSKSWRECIYVDSNTCSAIFSRQYPTTIEDVEKVIRKLLEKTISDKLGIDNNWKIVHNSHNGYTKKSELPYHDVLEGYDHKMIKHKELPASTHPTFEVGKDIYCVKCGKEISESGYDFVHRCSNCD